ncbi:MAG: hypothetical protein NC226_09355 [Bacteroides cellulosilyticus]|nr:hypothetical protein [Bacteroides cellulosilyticus]
MDKEWKKDKVIELADTRIINYSGRSLCDNYRNPLERCETAAQAIRLYKNCISWALQERYPTKEDLLSFAPKEVLAENGVFIDTEFDGQRIDSHICCVFLNCKGRISTGLNLEKKVIPMLYLSESSDLEITVDDFLIRPVPVELYYGSRATSVNMERLSVKDCNHLTAKENIGFSDEELSVDPDINNELL